MGDIQSARLIVFKGFLFLLLGLLALAGLVAENPHWRPVLLAVLAIWGFCRFYYFAFYVIEKYVDANYKFSSLWAFALYLWRRQR